AALRDHQSGDDRGARRACPPAARPAGGVTATGRENALTETTDPTETTETKCDGISSTAGAIHGPAQRRRGSTHVVSAPAAGPLHPAQGGDRHRVFRVAGRAPA